MSDTAQAGAPALPNAHDRSFVPYPLGLDPEFEKCLPDTLAQEGGYSNDAHDPGGMTMMGIIQREYDLKRRQWGLPTQWVKNISKDEMRTIYYTDYWCPYCPKLWAGLNLEFFDLDVNGGQHRAVETLQRVLGIPADGQWGPKTDDAVTTLIAAGNIPEAIEDFKNQREAFYRSLGTFRYFGKDWIRRSEQIEKQAEQLDASP
jgi:lysozyme family protein